MTPYRKVVVRPIVTVGGYRRASLYERRWNIATLAHIPAELHFIRDGGAAACLELPPGSWCPAQDRELLPSINRW